MALAKESMVMFTDGEMGRDSEVGNILQEAHTFLLWPCLAPPPSPISLHRQAGNPYTSRRITKREIRKAKWGRGLGSKQDDIIFFSPHSTAAGHGLRDGGFGWG
jgi:hypothetical protein